MIKQVLFALLILTSMACNGQQVFEKIAEVPQGASHQDIVDLAAKVVPSPNQLLWHNHEFIAFIHFGPNTFSRREWGNGKEDPASFNPVGMDTDQWCRLMKAAGMSKVIITVKHHDGFCLWQTRYTKHSVASTPWRDGKGDVLRDLSISCRKYDLKLGVYLSPADLYQMEASDGLYGNESKYSSRTIPRAVDGRPFKDKRTFTYNVDDYNEYFMNQLFELLTEYGPIHEVWFDGAHPKRKGGQQYIRREWYEFVHKLAPQAVIFGGSDIRWCGNEGGKTREAEWNVLPMNAAMEVWKDKTAIDIGSDQMLKGAAYLYYLPAEVNTSIRHGWFYRDDNKQNVRTPDDVFDIYERAVGGNAVFLLNIPPNRQGLFSKRDADCLIEVGKRIKAVYGNRIPVKSTVKAVLDGNPKTYWQAEGLTGQIEAFMNKPYLVNRFVLQEELAGHGQRIAEHALDAWVDGCWQQVASGKTVGFKKILRFSPVKTNRLRLRIIKSRAEATVSEISVHYYDEPPKAVRVSTNSNGKVVLEAASGGFSWKNHGSADQSQKIVYTLDGSVPAKDSSVYTVPLDLPNGGLLKACTIVGDKKGSIVTRTMGYPRNDWKLMSVDSYPNERHVGQFAFDGKANTYWLGKDTVDRTHYIAIDSGSEKVIGGFSYLAPKGWKRGVGIVEHYRFEVSRDGENWEIASEGKFGNILNDPSLRTVHFDKKFNARYFRFVALKAVKDNPWLGVAEIEIFAE